MTGGLSTDFTKLATAELSSSEQGFVFVPEDIVEDGSFCCESGGEEVVVRFNYDETQDSPGGTHEI